MKVGPATFVEIKRALTEYCNEVGSSDLKPGSQAMYIDHANNFVRWIAGEFDPGATKNPWKAKKSRNPTRETRS